MKIDPGPPSTIRRGDLAICLALVLVGIAVFFGAVSGDFVYDDRRQILENHLIRSSDGVAKALVSDVWAFKGEREEPWSNYWRPGFVLWLAGGVAVFGLGDPGAWHVANLLVHGLVTGLGFLLMRRMGLDRWIAAAAGLVFAVHPAHAESVAWISGAPDLLATAAILVSLHLVLPTDTEEKSRWHLCMGAAFGLVAMLTKEMAVALPFLAAALVTGRPAGGRACPNPVSQSLRAALPLAVSVALFLVGRWWVLGTLQVESPWRPSPADLAATLPSVAWFYLRQTFLPLWIGPASSLRAVDPSQLGFGNFWLPVGGLVIVAAIVWFAGRRDPVVWFGAVLFVTPLLPAFNIGAFMDEQIVHDRYLYLPLLGAALVATSVVRQAAACWFGRHAQKAVFALAAVVAIPLAVGAVQATSIWTSEVTLWESAVAADPMSAFALAQRGLALLDADRPEEALADFDRALMMRPVTSALIGRADVYRGLDRLDDAKADLERVLLAQPDNSVALERLAMVLEASGRLSEAAQVLQTGRQVAPHRRCSFTCNLAVIRFLQGRPEQALAELEGVVHLVGHEGTRACRRTPFYLGSLYASAGRTEDARHSLDYFIEVSGQDTDPRTVRLRREAIRLLGTLEPDLLTAVDHW